MEVFLSLIAIVIGIIAYVRGYRLDGELSKLQAHIEVLELRIVALMKGTRHVELDGQPSSVPPTYDYTPQVAPPPGVDTSIYAAPSVVSPPPVDEPPSVIPPWIFPSEEPAGEGTEKKRGVEWETLIGGNFLNRAGAVALTIGVAFLVKYGYDHHWITSWMLVVMIALAGVALLMAGAYTHRKGLPVFAQGLFGAGICILYIAAWAASPLGYKLVNQPMALLFMSAVTAVAIILALAYNAISISLFGLVGGFLTPVLLSTGEPNFPGLLGYLLLLNAGLLAVQLKKYSWVIIEPLAFFITWCYLAYTVSCQLVEGKPEWTMAATFIALFWGLFYVLDLYRNARGNDEYPALRNVIGVANAGFSFLALYLIMHPHLQQGLAWMPMAMGGAYFISALAVRRVRAEAMPGEVRFDLLAIGLLLLAVEIKFTGYSRIGWMSATALALASSGIRWGREHARYAALAIFALAVAQMLMEPNALAFEQMEQLTLLFTPRALAYALLIVTLAASAILFKGRADKEGDDVSTGLHYGWIAILFILITVETNDYFRYMMARGATGTGMDLAQMRMLTLAAVWTAYSLPLVWTGLRRNSQPFYVTGLCSLLLGFCFTASAAFTFHPISGFQPLVNLRALILLAVGVGLFLQERLLARKQWAPQWGAAARQYLQVMAAALIFELITVEIVDYFALLKHFEQQYIFGLNAGLALAMSLPIVWMLYSVPLMWWGLRKRANHIIVCAVIVMAAAVVAGVGAGYSFAPAENFALLLNYRSLMMCVVIGGMIAHLALIRRYPESSPELFQTIQSLRVVTALLIMQFLSVEAWSYFATGSWDAVRQENMRQMTLSLVWLIYAILLLGFSIWRKIRPLRILALLVLGITIFKVAVLDLRALEMPYRIISWIGLGVILLATSYLYQRFKSLIIDDGESASPPSIPVE